MDRWSHVPPAIPLRSSGKEELEEAAADMTVQAADSVDRATAAQRDWPSSSMDDRVRSSTANAVTFVEMADFSP